MVSLLVLWVWLQPWDKHKAKKQNKDEEKPKTKKKIVWQKPWKIENVDSAQVDVPDEDVEETSEEK